VDGSVVDGNVGGGGRGEVVEGAREFMREREREREALALALAWVRVGQSAQEPTRLRRGL
jgi:hypothetical protein